MPLPIISLLSSGGVSSKTVQHFSELGEKARLYTDPTEFAGALHA